MQKIKIKTDEVICIKASSSAYIVFICILGVPLIINLFAALQNEMLLVPVVLLLGLIIFAILWVKGHRIKIYQDKVEYCSFLMPVKSLKFCEIKSLNLEFGISRFSDVFLPPVRFVLVPKSMVNSKRIIINTKVFNRKNLVFVENFIKEKMGEGNA